MSAAPNPPEGAIVFDRALVRRHRARAAAKFDAHDFLFREVAERLVERLGEVRRTFPLALDLGSSRGLIRRALAEAAVPGQPPPGGIETLVELAPCAPMVFEQPALVADEERLPIAASSVDLVFSGLALHWVNDLPGALIQARHALKPDGLFLGALLGGDTLIELRRCLFDADVASGAGVAPRASPVADLRDLGSLMQRAGFALPVIDGDRLTVTYPDALALMRDLRGMGETNALVERSRRFWRRETVARAAALYTERHGLPDGRIPATFELIFLTGWKPHESQPKPLARGSGQVSLASALKTQS